MQDSLFKFSLDNTVINLIVTRTSNLSHHQKAYISEIKRYFSYIKPLHIYILIPFQQFTVRFFNQRNMELLVKKTGERINPLISQKKGDSIVCILLFSYTFIYQYQH